MGVVRQLNLPEVAPEIVGLWLMKYRHVFVPAVVEEAWRVAVVEILLLRTPRRRPGLDHLFLGGDLEPRSDFDSFDGVEFVAVTAADDVHHSRTRAATEQRRPSGSKESVCQVERLAGDQLGEVLRARGRIHIVGAQGEGGFHHVYRDERRREVDNDVHRAERFADGAGDLIGLPRVELRGHDFRAAEPVAHGCGVG